MVKANTKEKLQQKSSAVRLVANSSAFDPTLAALFSASAGPLRAPSKPTRKAVERPIAKKLTATKLDEDAETSDSDSAEGASVKSSRASNSAYDSITNEVEQNNDRPRKRRKVDSSEDLESKYLDKLIREEEQEFKQRRKQTKLQDRQAGRDAGDDETSDSDLNSGLEDLSDSEGEQDATIDEENALPKHESLDKNRPDIEADKLTRTVFLGNVSNGAIKSKSAKKTLVQHLQTGLDNKQNEKIESIRFRSAAFVSDAGPKRAAFAKKELMEETMKSTNAYAVVSTEAAARRIAANLNGTIVLDRHLRVDNLGNPSQHDHKRCVFVGNLSFVDEATATEETEDGGQKRKRGREPADVEEGLWRSFAKAGKVESVRVVRDKETRISKGFAYVQFAGENAVEAALLMDGKKFPPMLPRPLRVMRAKKDMKSSKRDMGPRYAGRSQGQKHNGFSSRGRPSAFNGAGNKVVFEGHRANSGSKDKTQKAKKRSATKPDNRSSKRAAAFKAGGKKKKRDL